MKLWKHQQYALEKYKDREYFGILFPCGCGKEQPLSSKVLTPSGYITMGEVKKGQTVLDGKGLPCTVTGIFPQGNKQLYKLTFSDNTSIRVGYEHLNRFIRHSRPVCHRCKDQGIYKMDITTEELIKQFNSKRYDFWCELPVCEFEPVSDLSIDPYLLGLLLGDGSLHHSSISFTNSEKDIVSKLDNLIQKEDCHLVISDSISYRISKNGLYNNLTRKIKDMKLNVTSLNKFIPKQYLYASVDDRIRLVQGLFDTDGHVAKNKKGGCSFEYSTSSKRLAEDITFLLRTLGCVVKVAERETHYRKEGKIIKGANSYRIHIKCPNDFALCTSEKHLARIVPRQASTPMRKLVSIETDGFEECQCIMVDSEEHTYITDNVTVTHNTLTSIALAEAKDRPVLIIAPNALCQQWEEEIQSKGDKEWQTVVCTSKTKKTKKFKEDFENLCKGENDGF